MRTHVKVVNSYDATADSIGVSFVSRVDFPTDGKPIMTTVASPLFLTSKPSPFGPPVRGHNKAEPNTDNRL